MNLSRRMFFSGAVALIAAPAIVKVESLMKLAPTEVLRPDGISLRMIDDYVVGEDQLVSRLDVLYTHINVRPEWQVYVPEPPPFTLDEFSERILAPMVERLQKQVANAVMFGSSTSRMTLEADGTGTLPKGYRELVPVIKPISLSDLLVEARRSTHSIE